MNRLAKLAAAAALTTSMATPTFAADEVNIGYFLEWATPNMIAKVEKSYDDALGVPVKWTAFEAGTAMTEAMIAGDIDISFSQGLAPFINGVNANAPIKMVGLAVQYPANECVVRNGAGIDASNASELEGKKVAVPLATMADFSFRMQMRALDVDIDKITVVDQVPADGVVSLSEGNVVMACVFGGNALAGALEVGKQLMAPGKMEEAGIVSFDVVSVREKFLQENPDMVKTFMEVTNKANMDYAQGKAKMDTIAKITAAADGFAKAHPDMADTFKGVSDAAKAAYSEDDLKLAVIQKDSGLKDIDATKKQMATMSFPSNAEQLEKYFGKDGIAAAAIKVVGNAFATKDNPAKDDYSVVIDTSFLK